MHPLCTTGKLKSTSTSTYFYYSSFLSLRIIWFNMSPSPSPFTSFLETLLLAPPNAHKVGVTMTPSVSRHSSWSSRSAIRLWPLLFLLLLRSKWKLWALHTNHCFLIGSPLRYHFVNVEKGRNLTKPCPPSQEATKIQYLLWLNKYGLEKFRDATIEANILVGPLDDLISTSFPATNKMPNSSYLIKMNGINIKTSLLFDLLKEAPQLLREAQTRPPSSSAGRSRKRKLAELETY